MKLMQRDYFTISKLEIELKQLEEATVPNRPRKYKGNRKMVEAVIVIFLPPIMHLLSSVKSSNEI